MTKPLGKTVLWILSFTLYSLEAQYLLRFWDAEIAKSKNSEWLDKLFFKSIIPSKLILPENFTGKIEFRKTNIPEGFSFPESISGDLQFYDCSLPINISLPKTIEGYFVVTALPHQ